VRQLTIISGAGINLGISAACPEADEMLNFTYQKISQSVYSRVSDEIRAMFLPDSFDYILGGLLTVNLAIEKTKQDLKRFNMDEKAFAELFKQSDLQASIISALGQIEDQLTISLKQMLGVVEKFSPTIEKLSERYDSINYFTVNFDGIFDHIIYGPKYRRATNCTDFWTSKGILNKAADKKIKVLHLHGDLRYKPNKKTQYSENAYRWPVLVVGDQEVKRGIIASNPALLFYNQRLKAACEAKNGYEENNLAIVGFGFREEDEHIIKYIKHGIKENVFDNIYLYDPQDRLEGVCNGHRWTRADQTSLLNFLGDL
jgi:UDP-2,3-diacylglucosamine pyrophosphatase LpxH